MVYIGNGVYVNLVYEDNVLIWYLSKQAVYNGMGMWVGSDEFIAASEDEAIHQAREYRDEWLRELAGLGF